MNNLSSTTRRLLNFEFRPIKRVSERTFDFPDTRCRQDAYFFPKQTFRYNMHVVAVGHRALTKPLASPEWNLLSDTADGGRNFHHYHVV